MGTGRSRSGLAGAVIALVAVVVVAGIAFVAVRDGLGPFISGKPCTASVQGIEVDLTREQAENASLITAVAVRRGLPARAASIALATAYQESKIRNLDNGDRDSLGLFQQRPSQGWGTAAQIQEPYHAINAFYDELETVQGYRDMRITEAAQLVQRSGFPEAYEDHAEDGRALASSLTGNSPASFTCRVDSGREAEPDALGKRGLTARAAAVAADMERSFGDLVLGGFAPGGVTDGHQEGSAHYDGRAVDVFFRPVNAANKRQGWALAHYLVAQADRLDVDTVIFDAKIWTARRSSEGWRDYEVDRADDVAASTRAVLLHRDHVHVGVAD